MREGAVPVGFASKLLSGLVMPTSLATMRVEKAESARKAVSKTFMGLAAISTSATVTGLR
jgi:hypothetical protein